MAFDVALLRGRYRTLGPIELLLVVFIVILFGGLAIIMRVLRSSDVGGADAARMERLERRVAALEKHLEIGYEDSSADDRLRELLRGGSKIEAIKAYREFHPGADLKEALGAIDGIEREMRSDENGETPKGRG